jgi:hypothetical protein
MQRIEKKYEVGRRNGETRSLLKYLVGNRVSSLVENRKRESAIILQSYDRMNPL